MAEPELILCDTSLVGVLDRAAARPDSIGHWPADVRDRLDQSVLAISVVTEAEVRAGWLHGKWGERRIANAELRLRAYAAIPVDRGALDVWPGLSAAGLGGGWNVSHNDLWIAATAISHALPLASCDGDHRRIEHDGLELIFLPVEPPASSAK